jgi:ammonium transporter, Amt family
MKERMKTMILGWVLVMGLMAGSVWAAEGAVAGVEGVLAEAAADAEEAVPTVGEALFTTHNLWMMICAALVFLMHLGFATLESGLTRAKNTVNVLFKNTMIVCIGILTYALVGFNLMYPGVEGGIIAMPTFGVVPPE